MMPNAFEELDIAVNKPGINPEAVPLQDKVEKINPDDNLNFKPGPC